jgi:hypothetical protein
MRYCAIGREIEIPGFTRIIALQLRITLDLVSQALSDQFQTVTIDLLGVCYSSTVKDFHLLLFADALAYNFSVWCGEPISD